MRDLEKLSIAKAVPVTAKRPRTRARQRGQSSHSVQITSPLPKATAFIRYVQALAVSKGSTLQAVEYSKRWHDSTPEVELVLKAAVAAGTTTDATWAGPLAPITPLTSDFLALLRPQTILGKVDTFFKVPFNVSVASQTGGGTYQWVGQGAPKPVGKLQFGTITLSILKCAGIIVITEELARTSTPSAEEVIRRDMIAGIAAFLDSRIYRPDESGRCWRVARVGHKRRDPDYNRGHVARQRPNRHTGARKRNDGGIYPDRGRRANPVGNKRARVDECP